MIRVNHIGEGHLSFKNMLRNFRNSIGKLTGPLGP